jgi:type I restriction enzyme S subunit
MAHIPVGYKKSALQEIKKWGEIKAGFTHFADNDVVMAKITPCFQNGKSAVLKNLKNGVGAGTTELHVFRSIENLMNPEYVLLFLKTPEFLETGIRRMTGSAGQKRVPNEYFSETPFPLPPLAEQHRIVAKVDRLMAICNDLEALQQEEQAGCHKLGTASLAGLQNAESPGEFEKQWAQVCDDVFDLILDCPENVAMLRQTILQMAVQGRLVRQEPGDEPAGKLVERIRKEMALSSRGGCKKYAFELAEKEGLNKPFSLPSNWEWIPLGTICELITKGSSPKWQGVHYVDENEGILFITSKNVDNFKLKLFNKQFVQSKFNEIEPRSILKRNDLLMNLVGASIGRTAIFESDEIANINQAVCLIRIFKGDKFVNLRYFLLFFNSPICISYMFDNQVESARANLSMTNVAKFQIPLPPLAEQHRIVAKVDALMALCDELEAQLKERAAVQGTFAGAVVKQVADGKS